MLVKMILNPLVSTKVGFFVWKVWWGKTLTMDQLKKGGFPLLVGVLFVGSQKKCWNTFLSIAQRFKDYGQHYFLFQKVGGFVPSW